MPCPNRFESPKEQAYIKALEKKFKDQKKKHKKLVANASVARAGTLFCPATAAAILNRMMGITAITKTLVTMIIK